MFDDENPIIKALKADDKRAVDRTCQIIAGKVKETGGVMPGFITSPIAKVSNYRRPSDYEHRFLMQWHVRNLPKQMMDALEAFTAYANYPNAVQGRRDPLRGKRSPCKYITVSGTRSQKKYGYLLKEWGGELLGSTGIWVCREFKSPREAKRTLKQDRDWLYHGKTVVEIRAQDGIGQLDFAENAVQVAHIIGKGEPVQHDSLVYSLYRDFGRIGTQEKTEQDIAGLDEMIEFMKWTLFASSKNERAAEYFKCRPESVLLAGVKGTGKTLVAEVLVSQDHNGLFVPISASQLVNEKYSSQGTDDEDENKITLFSAVQELQSRTNARVCLHCDDIEAALLSPEGVESEAHLATNSTLLNKLSGIRQSKNTTLSGSTNDPELIDPRFLRFGRIGYILHVSLPDEKSRDAILAIHTRGMPVDANVRLSGIAQRTDGYTPASLAEICNRAANYAMQRCAAKKAGTKDVFESLGALTEEDWKGEKVIPGDFAKAEELVARFADPNGNIENNNRVKRFCDDYNKSPLGFGRK